MLSPLFIFYLTSMNWPADHFPSLLVFLFVLFVVCVFFVWLCFVFGLVLFAFSFPLWDCDGSLDYVSVLASSSFEAFIE